MELTAYPLLWNNLYFQLAIEWGFFAILLGLYFFAPFRPRPMQAKRFATFGLIGIGIWCLFDLSIHTIAFLLAFDLLSHPSILFLRILFWNGGILLIALGVFQRRFRRAAPIESLLFLDFAPDGFFLYNVFTKKILWCNQRFAQMAGCTASQLKGENFYQFILEQEKAKEFSRILQKKGNIANAVMRIQNRQGERSFCELNAYMVPQFPHLAAGLIRDATLRIKAEKVQARLAAIVASTNVGIVGVDLEGMITNWNPAAEKIFGYSVDEIQGRLFTDMIESKNHEEARQSFHRLSQKAQHGYVEEIETIGVAKEGTRIHLNVAASCLFDRNGTVIGVSGIVQDISARKQAERELKFSNQRLQNLIDNSGDIIWELDPQGRFTSISGKVKEILGYSPEEMVGHLYEEFLVTKEKDPGVEIFRKLLRKREPYSSIIYHYLSKEGKVVFLRENGTPFFDEDDTFLGYLGVSTDVTERIEYQTRLKEYAQELETAYRQLRESHQRLQDIVDHTGDLIWEIDENGIYTHVSGRVEEILEYTPEEIVGTPYTRYLVPDKDYPWKKILEKPLVIQAPFKGIQNWGLSKTGKRVYFEANASPIFDEKGIFRGYRGVSTDKTERIQHEADRNQYAHKLEAANRKLEAAYQQAEKANQTKSEFLANISHELRTPLTAIMGFAELLSDQLQGDETDPSAEAILRNSKHLLELINDILDLSKVEAGELKIERLQVNIPQLFEEIRSLFRPRVEEKGLSFKITLDGPIPESIQSDPVRLRQIVINLIGNAVKFTDRGSIEVMVKFIQKTNPLLQIQVIDTGIGISKDKFATIFQPFSQADTSTTRMFGGTGLGLAISHKLARLLGGDITVESESDVGSVFTLTAATGPVVGIRPITELKAELIRNGKPEKITPKDFSELAGARILLAEDGRDNQRLVAAILKPWKVHLSLAENGEEAVQKILESEEKFDVVLMDMQMPIVDGYSATRQLRMAGYRQPIIAFTAHAMLSERKRSFDAGCDDYVTKPIDKVSLLNTILKYFEISRQKRPS